MSAGTLAVGCALASACCFVAGIVSWFRAGEVRLRAYAAQQAHMERVIAAAQAQTAVAREALDVVIQVDEAGVAPLVMSPPPAAALKPSRPVAEWSRWEVDAAFARLARQIVPRS